MSRRDPSPHAPFTTLKVTVWETVVLAPQVSLSAMSQIRDTSARSDLVLMGLRRPADGETDEAYGEYIRNGFAATASLPLVAFALASEDVDFKSIFA